MSIFASDITETVDLPFDPPHTITIQQLNGRQLERAMVAKIAEHMAALSALGGPRKQQELQDVMAEAREIRQQQADANSAAPETAQAAAAADAEPTDPMANYDPYVLLMYGLKSWTYSKSLQRVAVKEYTTDGREVTVLRIPAIDDLQQAPRDFMARAALKLSKPELFQTADERAEAQKNG